MFGHYLSKGVDIDKNGCKDIAVGAPNSEKVYVFKSYPVIKIVATITSTQKKLKLENVIPIKVCVKFESNISVREQDVFYLNCFSVIKKNANEQDIFHLNNFSLIKKLEFYSFQYFRE